MTEAKQTFDVPKLPVQHQQHQDLMKRWSGPQRHVSADPKQVKAVEQHIKSTPDSALRV